MLKSYDVIVIGGGPAGLSAALYAQRAGLKTLVVEKMIVGGQLNRIEQLDNYPGVLINGSDLADQMVTQVQSGGTEFLFATPNAIDLAAKTLTVDGTLYQARAMIIATGAGPRPLTAANQAPFLNNGIHYCATCDGPLYRGRNLVVVGTGVAAAEDALYLANLARQVILIVPTETLLVPEALRTAVTEQTNLTLYTHATVTAINGEQNLTGVQMQDLTTNQTTTLAADAVFVALGQIPNLDGMTPLPELSANGYVQTDTEGATNLPGVYAAGDVREKSLRQVATAVADGAIAATAIVKYLTTEAQ